LYRGIIREITGIKMGKISKININSLNGNFKIAKAYPDKVEIITDKITVPKVTIILFKKD
jgi:hypothetical protein